MLDVPCQDRGAGGASGANDMRIIRIWKNFRYGARDNQPHVLRHELYNALHAPWASAAHKHRVLVLVEQLSRGSPVPFAAQPSLQ